MTDDVRMPDPAMEAADIIGHRYNDDSELRVRSLMARTLRAAAVAIRHESIFQGDQYGGVTAPSPDAPELAQRLERMASEIEGR